MLSILDQRLNDFSFPARTAALNDLLALARRDPALLPAERGAINMHCHSFFSFNAYGYSPSALVWLAKKLGLRAAGIVDFDTLDGVEEFLSACDLAGVRGSAAMETRIYIPEFADRVTNSPGEPGISYHTGLGFASQKVNAAGKKILAEMRTRADQRNRGMVNRLNAYLDPLVIDYDRDVLPLTPFGNATERHMLAAYLSIAQRIVKDPAKFWAEKLGQSVNEVRALMANAAAFADSVRRKLMKRGGVAYVQPGVESFPTAEEFHAMVITNGALPAVNYLNGTTAGEQCMEELLSLLVGKGVVAMNIIPNLAIPEPSADPDNAELRRDRARLLQRTADLARAFDLPLHIGTEMNSYGQRQVDDLDSPELTPLKQRFIDGAFFIYGHVRLQRTLGLGYQSAWTASFLPTRAERNDFYTQVGFLVPPGPAGLSILKHLDETMSPKEILAGSKRSIS